MRPDLRAADAAERIAAMAALLAGEQAPDAGELDALCESLADSRKLVQRRAAETLAALAGRGVAVAERLHALLEAADCRTRWGGIYALALIGPVPSAARPTLVELLGAEDGDLRWAAADLLKRLAEGARAAVVGDLLAAARAPSGRRKMALYCLRDLEVAEAAEVAMDALADAAIDTRLAALATLAAVSGDRAAVADRIAGLVDDPDGRMQRAAAATLGSVGAATSAVRAALERAASSADAALRRAAERSLRALGGQR